jgi:hypothetical protein
MTLGFVVVVAAIGLFVLAPLTLAWASTDRLLVQRDRDPSLGLLGVTQGLVWASFVGFSYLRWRRERAASAQPQVEGRAEPGGPAAGG